MLKLAYRWNLTGSPLVKDPKHVSPELGDIRLNFRIGSFVSELLQWMLKTAPHTTGEGKEDKVVLVWPLFGLTVATRKSGCQS